MSSGANLTRLHIVFQEARTRHAHLNCVSLRARSKFAVKPVFNFQISLHFRYKGRIKVDQGDFFDSPFLNKETTKISLGRIIPRDFSLMDANVL